MKTTEKIIVTIATIIVAIVMFAAHTDNNTSHYDKCHTTNGEVRDHIQCDKYKG